METGTADEHEYARLLRGVKTVTAFDSDMDAAIVIRRAVKKELASMLLMKDSERNATLVNDALGEIGVLRSESAEMNLAP